MEIDASLYLSTKEHCLLNVFIGIEFIISFVTLVLILIVFQQPVLTTTESEVVDIGSCHLDGTIDVLTVQFSNSNPCASFICTVNCTNADKLFWIHAGIH